MVPLFLILVSFLLLLMTIFQQLGSTLPMKLPITNIDRGNGNAVVFLDLKKAFETVDHDILQSKMNLYGVQGIALDWFRSY